MSVGAERGGMASGWPDALPWIAVAVLALGAGAAACFASPALGVAALALPAAPLLVVAPDLAILALVAALPFDALAALDDTGMLTLTRLLGIAVLGGWVVHVVAHPRRRVRLGRPGLLLLAYVAFAAVSIGWPPIPDVALTALMHAGAAVPPLRHGRQRASTIGPGSRARSTSCCSRPPSWPSSSWYRIRAYRTAASAWHAPWSTTGRTRPTRTSWRTSWRFPRSPRSRSAHAVPLSAGGASARWCPSASPSSLPARAAAHWPPAPDSSRWPPSAHASASRVLAALALVTLLLPAVLPGGAIDILRARWEASGDDRLSGRLDIWRVGLAMMADRPLHGTGFGGFQDAFYQYMLETPVDPHFALIHSRGNRAPHNIYLSTFAELGLIGGTLLTLALAAHARALWQLRRAARQVGHDQAEDIALALLATPGHPAGGGLHGDLLLEKTPWLLLAIMQGASIAAGWDGAAEVRP